MVPSPRRHGSCGGCCKTLQCRGCRTWGHEALLGQLKGQMGVSQNGFGALKPMTLWFFDPKNKRNFHCTPENVRSGKKGHRSSVWLDLVSLRQPQSVQKTEHWWHLVQSIAEPPRLCWCAGWSLGWWNFLSSRHHREQPGTAEGLQREQDFQFAGGRNEFQAPCLNQRGLDGSRGSELFTLGQRPRLPALKQGHTKGNVRELDANRVISMNLGGTICQLSDSWSWQHHAAGFAFIFLCLFFFGIGMLRRRA